MKTTVAKFGGTSLAGSEQFIKVKNIIKNDPSRRYIVASAPGKRFDDDVKVTDLLMECYKNAASRKDFWTPLLKVKKRFSDIIGELRLGTASLDLDSEINAISVHLKAYPEMSYILSRGEYLNSRILAAFLGYGFVDAYDMICFDEKGVLDNDSTYFKLSSKLKSMPNAVIPGFYGRKPGGSVCTFSRGGSDITGSLVAEAVKADLYENWTDVPGLLEADPRIVDCPKTARYITYRELRTLSYMGASVLHTDAVNPVSRAGIPVNIRNTNDPDNPGTFISDHLPPVKNSKSIHGVAGRKGLSVIQVEKIMVSDGAGFTAVVLDIFKKYRVPFEQCLTGIDTVTVVIRSDLLDEKRKEILDEINSVLRPDVLSVIDHLAMITVVGESAVESSSENIRVLNAVKEAGIGINTVNQGAGMLNLIIGVSEKDYDQTIRIIYKMI